MCPYLFYKYIIQEQMIALPCAKVNLGLNVVSRREDGYHDIETVFLPIPLFDALEINVMDERFPSTTKCDLKVTGNAVECDEADNLVVKAYNLLSIDHALPRVHMHLHKSIPSQAGLGGGSSDAASALCLLNEQFQLHLNEAALTQYASRLGADCAFFVKSKPAYATGIGDILSAIDLTQTLNGCYMAVVKPGVSVSTKEAYSMIVPKHTSKCCRDIVSQPVETWKQQLTNDFELAAFSMHPELAEIKAKLYQLGAVYAQMSGSGSAFFALFRQKPEGVETAFRSMYTVIMRL